MTPVTAHTLSFAVRTLLLRPSLLTLGGCVAGVDTQLFDKLKDTVSDQLNKDNVSGGQCAVSSVQ